MVDIFDEIAEEAADLSSAPSDAQIASLREKAKELVVADNEVERLTAELETAKKKKLALEQKELPEIFNLLDVDSFGLPDAGEFGVDLLLVPYFKASIPADWEEDLKERAFDHLEALGGGDIVRTDVKFSLSRGQLKLASAIATYVKENAQHILDSVELDEGETVGEVPDASITKGVPWNSLTSFVKERNKTEVNAAKSGEKLETYMDVSLLNATVGQIVKIKARKETK